MRQEAWNRAMALIPCVTNKDIEAAVGGARMELGREGRNAFESDLSEALRRYVIYHLLAAQNIPPSRLAQRLDYVAKHTEKVLLSAFFDTDPVGAACRELLHRQFTSRAVDLALVLNLLPFPEIAEPSDAIGFAIDQIGEAIALLRDAARDAEARQRHQIARRAKSGSTGHTPASRHAPDLALREFFGTLNGLWIEWFGTVPGITWNAHARRHGGQYVEFVESILRSYATKIPDELEHHSRGLRARLRLTRQAIHGHFRRTGISRLRRIAKSISDRS